MLVSAIFSQIGLNFWSGPEKLEKKDFPKFSQIGPNKARISGLYPKNILNSLVLQRSDWPKKSGQIPDSVKLALIKPK